MQFSYIYSIGDGNNIKPYIEITGVSGGTEPYYYSLTGLLHQTATTFNNLVYGYHVIHVSDSSGQYSAYKSVYIPKPPTITGTYDVCLSKDPEVQLNFKLNLDNTKISIHTDNNRNVWTISTKH